MQRNPNLYKLVLGTAFFLNMFAVTVSFPPLIEDLMSAGWILFGIGALLYILSVITLRRRDESHIVESGVYGLVRHPLYLGAMIMFCSHIFLGQNWLVVVGTIVAVVCCYLLMLADEQQNVEAFGDDYKRYMQTVPRMNVFLGILRLLQRRRSKSQEVHSNLMRD
jgi:protein-S-isoprenylcysteine O-methyltransferase Ste14